MLPIRRDMMGHYQAVWGTKCGSGVLVFWDGKKPEKTQLEEHEETCPECKAYYRKQKLDKLCSKLVTK